jgi:hypothetical protein
MKYGKLAKIEFYRQEKSIASDSNVYVEEKLMQRPTKNAHLTSFF